MLSNEVQTIEVFHIETGVIERWSLNKVLKELNRDRSSQWKRYTSKDYIETTLEGLEHFTEYRALSVSF